MSYNVKEEGNVATVYLDGEKDKESSLAVFNSAELTACSTKNEGQTTVQNSTTTVTLTTCIKANEAVLKDQMSIE